MKIKMTSTARGTDNGFSIRQYEAGKEYEVGSILGCHFVNNGFANSVEESHDNATTGPATQAFYDAMDELMAKRQARTGG